MYMNERFGAWPANSNPLASPIEFKVFFPGRNTGQFGTDGKDPDYGNHHIESIQVCGDFQTIPWDPATAPHLTQQAHPFGEQWYYQTPQALGAGFYEYKYIVTFENGAQRWVSDPCCRYGGRRDQNAGVAVGGMFNDVTPLDPTQRKQLRDLVVYELHIDDFTAGYRGADAPIKAIIDKLDYLQDLGVGAIELLPWTAWPSEGYSWGYTPYLYFSVEQYYTEHLNASDEPNPVANPSSQRLVWLKNLITECHRRNIQIIMDGVFNHVGCADLDPARTSSDGFPYPWFYQTPSMCPYVGQFGGTFPGLTDLDYNNNCLQQFIGDVCFYWIDEFKIDGLRLDNTTNFYVPSTNKGLPQLISDINTHTQGLGIQSFPTILEHLDLSAATVTNSTNATSYWNNALYQCCFDYLWNGNIDTRLIDALNTHSGLNAGKVATLYTSNHDHSHAIWQGGARGNAGSMQWYRLQPYLIALFTAAGSPLIHSGTEFGQDFWIPEDDRNTGRRIRFRPLQWEMASDTIGSSLFNLHKRLIALRNAYPALRSDNFYPASATGSQLSPDGFGVDIGKGIAVYHRWGNGNDNSLQRLIIVLNFSDLDQVTDLQFPANGTWTDLLSNQQVGVGNYRLTGQQISSNWGRIYFQ